MNFRKTRKTRNFTSYLGLAWVYLGTQAPAYLRLVTRPPQVAPPRLLLRPRPRGAPETPLDRPGVGENNSSLLLVLLLLSDLGLISSLALLALAIVLSPALLLTLSSFPWQIPCAGLAP